MRELDFRSKSIGIGSVDPDYDDIGETSYAPVVERVLPREAVQVIREYQYSGELV